MIRILYERCFNWINLVETIIVEPVLASETVHADVEMNGT